MVAVVSGSGLGLFNSSTSLLGGAGANGNAQAGRGRDQVYVNTTTGNLIVQSVDETLSALGLDFAGVRTYNSHGLTDEDNNDQWRLGVHQRIYNLVGTVNAVGSKITKVFGDGSEVVYTWNATRSRYESTDGDGANDFMSWNGTNSTWTWTDGSGRNTEEYGVVAGEQRIRFSRDADGNTVTYTYANATHPKLLTSIAMAGATAQTVFFDYNGTTTNLGAIRVVSNGVTQTLTRYGYDTSNRLQTVTVDLTPGDNSVTDNVTYTTTYTYDGSSKRIQSITQKDGSSVAFTYQDLNGNYRLRTVTDAEGRVTTYNYSEVIAGGGTPGTGTAIQNNLSQTENVPHNRNSGALITPPGGGWGSATTLDSSNVSAGTARIAYTNSGDGMAVWRQGANVVVRRFSSASGTWGPETLFTFDNVSSVSTVQLALDAVTGSAVIAWSQSVSGTERLFGAYMAANGVWTGNLSLDSAAGTAMWADGLAVSVAGTHAAVAYVFNGASGEQHAKLVRISNGTASSATVIDNATYNSRFTSVANDASGNVVVGWQQMTIAGGERTYTNRWVAATQTFSGPQLLDTHVDGSRYVNLGMDSQGNAFAIWRQYGGLHVRRMNASTGVWDTPFMLQTNTDHSPVGFRLDVDSAGNAIAGWMQYDGTANSMFARVFSAATGTWGAVQALETDSAMVSGDDYVTVSINGNRAVAAWMQTNGVRYDIYAATYNNGTWSARELMETREESTSEVGSAVDGAGNSSVTWIQADGWARSPYHRRFAAGGGSPYYPIPSSGTTTWQMVAAAVYNVNSPEAGAALQTALSPQTIVNGGQLTGFPPTLSVPTTVPWYVVVNTTDWAQLTQHVYGVQDPGLTQALQAYTGLTTLTLGVHLPVPLSLPYTVGGSGSGPSIYQRVEVVDDLGLTTIYLKDSFGRLLSVQTPVVGGARNETRYTYDPVTGNVATITEDPNGLNRVTTFTYDPATGLLVNTRDSLGNTVARTYNSSNQLETETSYQVRDPDGAGSGAPSSPLVSRYIYDSEHHLRFSVSADGRVIEHIYDLGTNGPGLRTTTYKYAANTYTGSYTESALNTWASGQRSGALERVDYAYDFRGNVSTLTAWAATNSSGVGTGPSSVTRFIYDQRGMLLTTVEARGEATSSPTTDYTTSYTYDGLGRLLTTTSWVSGTETARAVLVNTYDDLNRRTVSTFANGLTKTLTYNRAGELISIANGPAALGTSSFTYDDGGRLRVTTDFTGVKEYNFYDDAGRKIGGVDGDGSLTEFIYNRADELIKTVRYSTRLSAATLTSLSGGAWSSVAFSTLRTEANAVPAASQIVRNVFDASGTLVYTIDQIGAVTKFTYDGAGRLKEELRYRNLQVISASVDQVLPGDITVATHADDRKTRHFYNGDGYRIATLDGAGFLVENVFDAAGRQTAQVGYYNAVDGDKRDHSSIDTMRPGAAGSVAQLDPARDITTRFFYDAQGRRIGALDGERYLTETVYDVAGLVSQSIRYDRQLTFTPGSSNFDSLKAQTTGYPSHTTTYTYNGLGQVLTETNFENTQTLYTYDVAGNVVQVTRANATAEARTTATRYDVLGRVTQELSAEGSVALAALGGSPTQGQIDTVWNNHGVTYTYDNAGRRTSATVRPNDSQINTTYFYYDNDGRVRFELNPLGRVTENRYDALGQLVDRIEYYRTVTISSPTGGLLTPALITALSATESANVHEKTTYSYTLRGEVNGTTTAGGATTSTTYNTFGDVLTRTAGTGFTPFEYTYDTRGYQKLTVRGGTTFENRTYDSFGRLSNVVDARGNATTITFDRLGRELTSVQVGDANSTLMSYDGFSRVLTARDKLLNTTSYLYDDATRTVTVTTPEGIVVSTVHNRHGDTLTVTAAGNTTTYAYDRDGRLTGASDNLGALEGRGYDRAGRQVTATDARGIITTLAYDAASRLLSRIEDSAAGGLQLTTTYSYDPNSRIMNVTAPGNRLTRTEYDRDGRVYAVTVDPNGITPSRTEYGYDAANNVITVVEGVGSLLPRRTRYVYDALGRRSDEYVDPTSMGGTLNLRTQYKYDNNDNVTRKIDASGNSTWYVYDAQNRLSQTVDALGGVTQLTYDSADRVIATRRFYNTVVTTGLGDTPAAQSVTTTLNDRVTRSVYDRDGREKYTIDTVSATGSPGSVTETGIVTERTFDAAGNVTRTRVFRNAITVPVTPGTTNVASALTAAGNDNANLHALDHVEWTAYDLRSRAVFTVDGAGAVVRTSYDISGNVSATTAYATHIALTNAMTTASLTTWSDQSSVANYARNRTTRFWYDTLDRQRFSLDGEGYLVETVYLDATNQERTVVHAGKPTVAAGATLAQVVSAAAAVPAATQAFNQTTTQTFDAAGRVVQVTDANGRNEYFGYDAVGNKVRYVNQKAASATDLAYTWTYEYDANHRLVYERSPAVAVTTITDSGATLTAATNASLVLVTHNFYDALGNVITRIEAEGTTQARTTSYEYDVLGRQTATVSPTVGVYDAATGDSEFGNGAVVQRRETLTQIRSETAYDVFGNAFRNRLVTAAAAINPANGTYTYKAYDNLGRVKYEVDAKNQVTSYVYDTFGNKTGVTRHAAPLTGALPTTGTGITQEQVAALVTPNSTLDRTITSTFDRLNRAITIVQPSVQHFIPTVGGAGGSIITAAPTVEHAYNAFGEVVYSRELVSTGTWLTSYFYFDNRGLKVAELDSSRALTRYFYDDETGDLTRTIEYSRPTTGTVDVDSYGTIVTSTGGNAAGDDRDTSFTYDKLNRKITETRTGLEYSSISGGVLSTSFTGSQTTTYGYDALGNQTLVSVVDPVSGSAINTYTYYDVLGRTIAIAQPGRNLGQGTTAVPYTRLLRDAHGNLVQKIEYYDSIATPAADGSLPTTPTGNAALNRVTSMLVDLQGNALRTEDATGADRFASYNTRGDVAKEWQVVVNPNISSATTDDTTETVVTLYRYDSVGQRTQLVESQRYNGAATVSATRITDYNAFGEVIAKYNQGATTAEKQYFDYDQAGRVWRTNSEDGVDKVLMYDLAGNNTLELRSKTIDLASGSYTSAQNVVNTVSATNLLRTETAYDLRGNIIERRLPTFEVSTGLTPVGTNLQLTTINGSAYVNWNGTLSETVNETFEYRVAGSTGAYSTVNIEQLSAGLVGANVHSLYNVSYEYRIRYTRANDSLVFAESTGTFRVDRGTLTSFSSISLTPPDTTNDVSALAIVASGPSNLTASYNGTTGWNGFAWQGQNIVNTGFGNLGNGPLRVFVTYTNMTRTGTPHSQVTRQITPDYSSLTGVFDIRWTDPDDPFSGAPEYGGLWSGSPINIQVYGANSSGVFNVLLAQTNAPAGPPMLIWNQPPDSTIVANFRYKRAADSTWQSVQAERFGSTFRVAIQNLLISNTTYNYEVEYVRAGVTIAKRGGDMNSTGVVTTRTISGASIGDAPLTGVFNENVAPPSIVGTQMVWSPPTQAVQATFEYKIGAGSYFSETIVQGTNWSVALGSRTHDVTHDYRITYRIGERVVSQQIGTFSVTTVPSSTNTSIVHTPVSNPAPVPDVQTLAGTNGVASATAGGIGSMHWSSGNEFWWQGPNRASLNWASVGAGVPIRVELFYRQLDHQDVPTSWIGGYHEFFTSSMATGSTDYSWYEPEPRNGVYGGIDIWSGIRVVVWGRDASNNYTVKLRETNGTGTPGTPKLNWTAPADTSLVASFAYSGPSSGTLPVTRNGGTATVELGSLQGTFNFTVTYTRPGESAPVITRSGGSFTTNGATSTVGSQGSVSNRNTADLTVVTAGSNVSWTRAAAGNTVTFLYRVAGSGAAWSVNQQPTTSDNTSYLLNLLGLPTNNYEYRVEYRNGTQPMAALAQGYLNVTTTQTSQTDILSVSTTSNTALPTQRITSISIPSTNSDVVSWNYARINSNDIIEFQYTVGGTTHSAAVLGSGPAFSAQLTALGIGSGQSIPWTLTYRRVGETNPYAKAAGTLGITITGSQTNPVVTISSQAPQYPSGVIPLPAPTDLGNNYLGWASLSPQAGSTVTLRINGSVYTTEVSGSGRRIDLSALGVGTYTYELTFEQGASPPYARAVGSFTVSKGPGAITGLPFTIAPPRAENILDFTPGFTTGVIVYPPFAVYWMNPNGQGGPRLEYGAKPLNEGGGYDANGQLWDTTYQYDANAQIIWWPRTTGEETEGRLIWWPIANPNQTTSASVAAIGGSWNADMRPITTDGTYGYRIEMRRTGALEPYATQSGTFTRSGGGATRTITPTSSTAPTLTSVTPTMKQTFDRWGNLIESKDALNNTTNYRYDGRGQLVQTLEALDIMYSTNGGTVPSNTPGRAEKTNYYDLLGRLIETQDGYDKPTRVTYNAAGQQLTQRNADYARADSNGATTSNVYDIFGNLLQTTDEAGFKTRFKYDKLGRVIEIWRENNAGGFTSQTDASSTAGTFTGIDANLQVQRFVYDEIGRRVSETNGMDNEVTRYRYDHRGNVTQRMTPQQAANSTPSVPLATFYTYDLNGKLITEVDAIGGTKSWTYNAFGRLDFHTELQDADSTTVNGATITYNYNEAGALTSQTSNRGQSISYSYDTAGNLTGITDNGTANGLDAGVNRQTLYRYDAAGRRSRETVFVDGRQHQDVRISYDGHNRIIGLDDPDYREIIKYDANGNRSNISVRYIDHQNRVIWETFDYEYDEVNRVLKTTHYSNSPFGFNRISTFKYNGRGDRLEAVSMESNLWERRQVSSTATYYIRENTLFRPVRESYTYDGLSRLKTVRRDIDLVTAANQNPGSEITSVVDHTLIHTYRYDSASRVYDDTNSNIEAGARVERVVTNLYDLDGRASTITTRRGALTESVVSYGRSTGSGANWTRGYDDAGNLRWYDVESHNPSNGAVTFTTQYKSTFGRLGESYLETSQSAVSSGSGPLPGNATTTRSYNINGELVKFADSGDVNRTRYFANDQSGQVLTSIQGSFTPAQLEGAWNSAILRGNYGGNGLNWAKAQYYFFANGNMIGTFGQMQRNGNFEANFDVNYTKISDSYPSSVPSTVVAQAGDTLRTIAARVFGDANLWYIIGEENGLSNPDADIPDGTQLRIPNDVISIGNTSDSFKPYNPADALGDTTPTQPAPPPPKGGCGVIGMIIMIVVMVVVTIFTAGVAAGLAGTMATSFGGIMSAGAGALAAGVGAVGGLSLGAAVAVGAASSVITQGIGMALGIQEKFDWKQVAMGAITAGVGGVVAKAGLTVQTSSALFNASANAVISNSLTQGVSIAVGLQKKFDWRSVAQSAVAAPLASAAGKFVGEKLGGLPTQPGGYNFAKFASDSTSTLVTAGVRSAMGGRFDVKQVAADIFGNAIGNAIVGATVRSFRLAETAARREAMRARAEKAIQESFARMDAELRQSLTNNKPAIEMPELPVINFPTDDVEVAPAGKKRASASSAESQPGKEAEAGQPTESLSRAVPGSTSDKRIHPAIIDWLKESARVEGVLRDRLSNESLVLGEDPNQMLRSRGAAPGTVFSPNAPSYQLDGKTHILPGGTYYMETGEHLAPLLSGGGTELLRQQLDLNDQVGAVYEKIPYELRPHYVSPADALTGASMFFGVGEVALAFRGVLGAAGRYGILSDIFGLASEYAQNDLTVSDVARELAFMGAGKFAERYGLGPDVAGALSLDDATSGMLLGQKPSADPMRPSQQEALEQSRKQWTDEEWAIRQGINPLTLPPKPKKGP